MDPNTASKNDTPLQEISSDVGSPAQTSESPKKRYLLLGIVFLAFIIAVFLYVTHKETTRSPSTATTTYTPITPISKLLSNVPYEKWYRYRTAYYTVSYPPDWRSEVSVNAAGVASFLLRPKSIPENSFTPSLAIDLYATASAAPTPETYISLFHLTKSDEQLSGISATKLEGVAPYQELNGVIAKNPAHNVLYIIQNAPRAYVLRYQYTGGGRDLSYEEMFGKVITSFTLTHQ